MTVGRINMPDTLPGDYGEFSGGEYGRLAVQDAQPYRTNRPPFVGPGGTMPLNRGGPNLPAYAPPAFEHPDNAAGSEVHGLFDFLKADPAKKAARQARRAARKAARGMAYRDVLGSGGYRYRQYADGTIEVLPGSPKLVGVKLTPTGKYAKHWQAVTAEIGPYNVAANSIQALTTALQSIATITSSTAQLYANQSQAATPTPAATTSTPDGFVSSGGGVSPFVWIAGGLALLGGIVLIARR